MNDSTYKTMTLEIVRDAANEVAGKNGGQFNNMQTKAALRGAGYWATQGGVSHFMTELTDVLGEFEVAHFNGDFRTYQLQTVADSVPTAAKIGDYECYVDGLPRMTFNGMTRHAARYAYVKAQWPLYLQAAKITRVGGTDSALKKAMYQTVKASKV